MTLTQSLAAALALPDRRPIYEWAADNVELPPVLTKTGKFQVSGSRQFIGPMDALRSEFVREVNVQAPVRGGKTLIADISAPWAVLNEHASLLWVFQTDILAKAHCELRAMPTMKSVPGIQELLPTDRHQERKADIVFSNGLPFIVTGPAIGNLQSRGFKWVICDEPWLYAPGILGQAKARLGDFVRSASSKFLCISQGGTDEDDWDVQFRSGEINEWHVQCASCGHYMQPLWSAFRPDGTRWGFMFDAEKDARKNYNLRRALETMRFECEKCAHPHLDSAKTRAMWNTTGQYRVIGEEHPTVKSFHWTALIDYPWGELLKEWLKARRAAGWGNFEPTIQFCQKRLAEPKSEKTVHMGTLAFARAAQTQLPEKEDDEHVRIITVDRQSEDVFWLTGRRWSRVGGRSERIMFRQCYSEADIQAVVAEFKPTSFMITIGNAKVRIVGVFIDSGYRPKGDQGVYAMCARNGWAALKGTDEPYFFHNRKIKSVTGQITTERVQRFYAPWTWGDPGEGTADQGKKFAPLLRFSSNPMSDRLQDLIDRAMWIEPEGDSETENGREYDRQMSDEIRKKRVNSTTGREEFIWHSPGGNNHARDCGKMQVTMATHFRLL